MKMHSSPFFCWGRKNLRDWFSISKPEQIQYNQNYPQGYTRSEKICFNVICENWPFKVKESFQGSQHNVLVTKTSVHACVKPHNPPVTVMCSVQHVCKTCGFLSCECVCSSSLFLPSHDCVYDVTYHCLYLCVCVAVLQDLPWGGNESEWALPPPRCPRGLASVSVMHSRLVQTPLPSVLLLCHCQPTCQHPHWVRTTHIQTERLEHARTHGQSQT